MRGFFKVFEFDLEILLLLSHGFKVELRLLELVFQLLELFLLHFGQVSVGLRHSTYRLDYVDA